MVGLSGEQQFKLRAKKALETGDRSFKPRGAANKATFAKLKEELDKQAARIMAHTTHEADRVLESQRPTTDSIAAMAAIVVGIRRG